MSMFGITRRNFFRSLGFFLLGGAASKGNLFNPSEAQAAPNNGPLSRATRKARKIDAKRYARMLRARLKAFRRAQRRRLPRQRSNNDIKKYGPAFAYTKVLPKNSIAEPNERQFSDFRKALTKGKLQNFENTVSTGAKGFKNPIAAHAVDLEGYDASQFSIPPAPSIVSDQGVAEMAELYWMALVRDVKFADYWTNETISAAASDLSSNHSALGGLTDNGQVTPGTIFRADVPGRTTGPYVSQFLFKDVESGRLLTEQKIQTAVDGADWLTDERFYTFRQGGNRDGNEHAYRSERRYIITGRDLAMYVWDDRTYVPYLHAFLILFTADVKTNFGNPYRFTRASTGFLTGSYAHFLAQIAEVTTRALTACWWQKWNVHLRMRPEEAAGRIHFHKTNQASYDFLPSSLLNAESVSRIFDHNGSINTSLFEGNAATYLLPQVYPEGCPNHPAYPSGHSTMAGACATLLKAFFDENEAFPDPKIPNDDGSALEDYSGESLTVGGEINKLAANIAEARNHAGIHYRTDMQEGLLLGEAVAIEMLRQWNLCYAENFRYQFTKFDGSSIEIR